MQGWVWDVLGLYTASVSTRILSAVKLVLHNCQNLQVVVPFSGPMLSELQAWTLDSAAGAKG